MEAWGDALTKQDPEHIRNALAMVATAHPDWPPTLGQFVNLCKAPIGNIPAHRLLPAPAPRSEIAPEVLGQVAQMFEHQAKRDPKQWAREILTEAASGTYRYHYGIQCAKEALGVKA